VPTALVMEFLVNALSGLDTSVEADDDSYMREMARWGNNVCRPRAKLKLVLAPTPYCPLLTGQYAFFPRASRYGKEMGTREIKNAAIDFKKLDPDGSFAHFVIVHFPQNGKRTANACTYTLQARV
jgi:hypothetical protein